MVHHFILPYRFTPSIIAELKLQRHDTKANCFTMGGEEFVIEEPEHKVCLNSYYLGIYEVAQQKFENAMGHNPSRFKGLNLPAENVSWPEVNAYFPTLAGRFC